MSNKAIQAEGLCKSYKGNVKALREVSFEVEPGELFGLIGADGAGKTSLIRILTTLLLPDSGEALVAGHNVVKDYKYIRKIVGYMPGKFSLYEDLSVEENLNFFASVFGTTVDENYDLIQTIYSHIEPFKTRKAGALSGGMKQKLALSCALIHKPKVLFLDEPTTGVDAVSRKEFWEMLKELQSMGLSILVSTPYMDEAELCDRVALISDGKIMTIDTPANIRNNFKHPLFKIRGHGIWELLTVIRQLPDTRSVHAFGQSVHYTDKNTNKTAEQIEQHLKSVGLHVEVSRIEPLTEDCFMEFAQQREA